jgi:hypothetical protein
MEQGPSWEADRFSASQEIPRFNLIITVSIINKMNTSIMYHINS